ncbi:MAG: type II toxin-antitoxin system Phd/YefM family antitoxin [Gammaproteobacteria bacterium]|nr:type II toxin-antitoxin system Phd/YefM family antitoxin [Gammaproteobacteria bacterium]
MKAVNIHEAKTGLSRLLAEVEKSGKRFVICRNGEPIADLILHQVDVSMAADKHLGAIKIKYDPSEEADDTDWPLNLR